MESPSEKLLANIATTRTQLSKAEATVETLRQKLAKLEAKASGTPVTITGLDVLWKAALPMARMRSSKLQCRREWNQIPHTERPPVTQAIEALKIWNRCDEWKKNSNTFVPGLHRWIKNRQWEDLPETSTATPSRYRIPQKPSPPSSPDDAITDPAEIAKFLSIRPLRMNS